MAKRESKPTKGKLPIDLHRGGAVYQLARFYPAMSDVTDELIQNSLDAGASKIHLRIRMRTRFLSIRDNGTGMDKEKFETKVSKSIGRSIKSKDDLGQFGIGFMSPVGKCSSYKVTSCQEPAIKDYTSWTISIKEDDPAPEIDWTNRSELTFSPERTNSGSGTNLWWRTAIEIAEFFDDDTVNQMTIESIRSNVQMKFSHKMARNGTELIIEFADKDGKEYKETVTPSLFNGHKLSEYVKRTEKAGTVSVRMYLAKEKSKGRINIKFGELDNDFRFPFSNFRNSTAKEYLSKEIWDGLSSGIFEGEIVGEQVKLSPSRTCFMKNDALFDFCSVIEEWFFEVGREKLNDISQDLQKERYQKIGLDAVRGIEELLKDDAYAEMREVFDKIVNRTIGVGHKDIGKRKKQTTPSATTKGGRGQTRQKPDVSNPKPDDGEGGEKKNEIHLAVNGPKGSPRYSTGKNGSPSLQYEFVELPGTPRLWHLDLDKGAFLFNIIHPDWVMLDHKSHGDWKLQSLIELVTIQALTLWSEPNEPERIQKRNFADRLISHEAVWINKGGANPMVRSKRKK